MKAAQLIIVDDASAPIGRTQRLFAALMGCVLMTSSVLQGTGGYRLTFKRGVAHAVRIFVSDAFKQEAPALTLVVRQACACRESWRAVTLADARKKEGWSWGIILRGTTEDLPAGNARRCKKLLSLTGDEFVAWATQSFARIVADINAFAQNWKQRLGLWQKPRPGQPVTVATDCSGYGSELLALRLLGLQASVKSVMACESSKSKQALHRAMSELCGIDTSQCKYYSDIFLRLNDDAPRADLYTAGYPCPSYSRLGKRKGTAERRGMVTLQGLLYVSAQRPRAILLEQVAARQVWHFVLKILKLLEYEVKYAICNTRDFGIPQSRPRLYVVAVCKEALMKPLKFPEARSTKPRLHTFLDKENWGQNGCSCQSTSASSVIACGPKALCWTSDRLPNSNM
eukprot:s2839_g4.t1